MGCPSTVLHQTYDITLVLTTIHRRGMRKGRAVVDIRELNKLILPDAYPVPLQTETRASLQGRTHTSVIDAMFFYLSRVTPEHRFMLTLVQLNFTFFLPYHTLFSLSQTTGFLFPSGLQRPIYDLWHKGEETGPDKAAPKARARQHEDLWSDWPLNPTLP